MFIALNGLYEPSAIQQLPDGRFLVAEDEKDSPFSLLTLRPDGSTTVEPLTVDTEESSVGKLDDLEGLATAERVNDIETPRCINLVSKDREFS